MFVRIINLLIALVIVVQGGCLRACELQQLILGDNDDSSQSSVTTSTPSEQIASTGSVVSECASNEGSRSSEKSETCSCEFKKGLAQPERVDTGLAFDFRAPLSILNTVPPVADRPAVYFVLATKAPTGSQYTPLLI
jgi:hypothetical protein